MKIAVSAASDAAQRHVNRGMGFLNAGWDFEATRHFAAAMTEDPDCLLAHWGMVLCLIDPGPETLAARDAALERLLVLVENGAGTELERGYAYGLIKYIQDGPSAAAEAYGKVSARFPNELQAALLAALFGRGGFDPEGRPNPSQETSENALRDLMEKHPGDPVPQHALLFIRAEGAVGGEFLAIARGLALQWPDFPPYQHMLGHYEWRVGNHRQASEAFGRAAALYRKWMDAQGVGVADCPEWLKSRCYQAVALHSMGETEAALAVARELAAIPLDRERPASSGNRFLIWEVQTLPARLLISNVKGNARKAAATLPKPEDLAPFRDHSLAYLWIDGLRLLLEVRGLLEKGESEAAREAQNAVAHHGEIMARTRKAAQSGGEISPWSRAFRGMEILTSELRGDIALAGGDAIRASAFNWFSAAADRQLPAPLMMPPAVLTPMAGRLGDFLLAEEKKSAEAAEAYRRALSLFSNQVALLVSLEKALRQADRTDEAAEIHRQIESLKAAE
jgi:tetratricopeptide (TPR) repeat protein